MTTQPLIIFVMLVTLCFGLPTPSPCKPGVNCRLPDCRCWNDPNRPGDLKADYTPQMVVLTFSNGLTNWTVNQYLNLFKGLQNPNGCPPKATFFSEDKAAEEGTLRYLYERGHEVALTTPSGKAPTTKQGWLDGLLKSTKKLLDANIPITEMLGVLSPHQSMGGDHELAAMNLLGMGYDSSCVVDGNTFNGKNSLWPYTYDFVGTEPKCMIGLTPNTSFPGVWQFPIPEMSFKGHKCSKLSGCSPYIHSPADSFTFLYNSFESHYYAGRAPMVINIDSEWIYGKNQVLGLKQFLSTINRYETTWLVSLSQALEWIKRPEPISSLSKYKPWMCSKQSWMHHP